MPVNLKDARVRKFHAARLAPLVGGTIEQVLVTDRMMMIVRLAVGARVVVVANQDDEDNGPGTLEVR